MVRFSFSELRKAPVISPIWSFHFRLAISCRVRGFDSAAGIGANVSLSRTKASRFCS